MTPASRSNTEWLQSLPRTNGKPGVEGMRQLLAKLGDPQNYLDFVHVAGTNGKGTVSTLTANILKEAGYKTGLTISPYVLDFRERMQINGEMIPADTLEQVAGQVRAAAGAVHCGHRGGAALVLSGAVRSGGIGDWCGWKK